MPDIGARLLDVMLVAWGFISEFFRTATVLGFGHIRNELRPSNLVNVFSRYLLGIIVFFYEILLKFTTTRSPMGFSIFYILLYSIAWGLFGLSSTLCTGSSSTSCSPAEYAFGCGPACRAISGHDLPAGVQLQRTGAHRIFPGAVPAVSWHSFSTGIRPGG